MSSAAESYTQAAKSKHNFVLKKFIYDEQAYKDNLEMIAKLESKFTVQKGNLEKRCYFNFSELYIAYAHLKVIRTYIDGILRFGIPPQFLMCTIKVN